MPTVIKEKSRTKPKAEKKKKTLLIPQYNVVLLNDETHTYDYVIEMLQKLFQHSYEMAFLMACEVDTFGRVIVFTTHKERAEFKRDQIRSFGPDHRMSISKSSMQAIIEPVGKPE